MRGEEGQGVELTSLSCLSISLLRAFSSSVTSDVGTGADRQEPIVRTEDDGGVEGRDEKKAEVETVGSWMFTKRIRSQYKQYSLQFSFLLTIQYSKLPLRPLPIVPPASAV